MVKRNRMYTDDQDRKRKIEKYHKKPKATGPSSFHGGIQSVKISQSTINNVQSRRSSHAKKIDDSLVAHKPQDQNEWVNDPSRNDIEGVDTPKRSDSMEDLVLSKSEKEDLEKYGPKPSKFLKGENAKKFPFTLESKSGKRIVLSPQPTEDNPYIIENYPWGFRLKTQQKVWVETNKKGQRVVSQTKDPKNGRWCKPKKSTYNDIKMVYLNPENNHIENDGFGIMYSGQEDYDKFVNEYPQEAFSEHTFKRLANARAILQTRKHLKVSMVTNPSPEESKRLKEKNEKVNKELRQIYTHYRIKEKAESGY